MSRIQQLDPHVINRIAAGEVIERPASVVKELMENSVDALSTRIEVDISVGGTELIRITDNGEGMHPEDMELAVTSHATSKIRSDQDLEKVATLGFRGEALASIASISRFRIRTKREGQQTGQEMECEGGEIRMLRECGCRTGTTIEVHNLFFNTPARRKFLKKPSTEFGRISEQFAKVALPNPNLHLVLRHNDRLVYELPATTDQLERIRRFFGGAVADKLIAVESEMEAEDGRTIRLWGYVGEPSLSKGTRKDQYLFLNGRCIQDRSLQHALGQAYRGLQMVGRHPVSFLFLEVPPHLVDVNVHPTKTEVRFQDSQSLYRQLLHTLRDKFRQLEFQSELQVPVSPAGAASSVSAAPSAPSGNAPTAVQKDLAIWSSAAPIASQPALVRSRSGEPATGGGHSRSESSTDARHSSAAAAFHPGVTEALRPVVADSADPEGAGERQDLFHSVAKLSAGLAENSPSTNQTDSPLAAPAIVVGEDFRAFQIHDCYLVVAGDDGLEIIDQHALHERILYEYLRKRVLDGGVERQKLLIPEPIECSAGEAATLLEYQELLGQAVGMMSEKEIEISNNQEVEIAQQVPVD